MIGTPAIFVKMAGCPFDCDFCDSKSEWNARYSSPFEDIMRKRGRYAAMPVDVIAEHIYELVDANEDLPMVVFNGGEPLAQAEELAYLVALIRERYSNARFQVETSGGKCDGVTWIQRYPAFFHMIWLTVSPNERVEPDDKLFWRAKELRFLVHQFNEDWASGLCNIANKMTQLTFQPLRTYAANGIIDPESYHKNLQAATRLAHKWMGRVSVQSTVLGDIR
jgi:organic radical activating enzyme